MLKKLVILLIFFVPNLLYAKPSLDGNLYLTFKVTSEKEFIIPPLFTESTNIYITTQNGKDAIISFYKGEDCILTGKISESTGANDLNLNITYLNHSLGHLHFDWETDGVEYRFRTIDIQRKHFSFFGEFGSLFNFATGAPLTFEVFLNQ